MFTNYHRDQLQTSYVFSQQPILVQSKASLKPFVPHQTDQEIIQSLNKRDIDQEKINLLHVLQNQLPLHQFEFVAYIFTQHKIDEDIEQIQLNLMQDQSFSVGKLFAYFDVNQDRQIQFDDFSFTLQRLDIVLKKHELYQLFKRLGGENDNIISFGEFNQLFAPKKYRSPSFWQRDFKNGPYDQFIVSEQSQRLLKDMFTLYMNIERRYFRISKQSLEELRKKIGTKEILMEIFQIMDQEKRGYLVCKDLQQFIQNLGGRFHHSEFKRMFHRISKYRSGRVSFDEFLTEFATPETLEQEQIHLQILIEGPQQNDTQPKKDNKDFNKALSLSRTQGQNQYQVNYQKKFDIDEAPPIQGFKRYVLQPQGGQ